MLSSVTVEAPKLKGKLAQMRIRTMGWQKEAQQVAMRGVAMLQNITPASEGLGSQGGEHAADGWELHTIGGKVRSGKGLLMVIYNKFFTTVAGEILDSAKLEVQGVKQPYTLLHILEYGSRPHKIPRDEDLGKNIFLRFFWKKAGKWVVTRQVDHPGTAPVGMIRITRGRLVDWWKEFIEKWKRDFEKEFNK